MKNLVLFGPPGSGKGTQATLIEEVFGFMHLSTGDLFRHNIKNNTTLGAEAQSYISKGLLVPDSLTLSMLSEAIAQRPEGTKGIIFDGFPRTVAQAKSLDTLLQDMQSQIDLVIGLEVTEATLVQRLLERGKTSGRADDVDPAVIKTRIQTYETETKPVKAFYEQQGNYQSIQGEQSIEEITTAIRSLIADL